MPVVMRVVGMTSGISMGPMEGWYVHYVNVQESPFSQDWIQLTPDIDDAWIWDSIKDATDTWREILSSNPVRPDGKANRPMTVFSVDFVHLPDPKKEDTQMSG